MEEILTTSGWKYYKTGCSCSGSPKYYNHVSHIGVSVILRKTNFKIQKDGYVIASGTETQLITKLQDNGLI